MSNDEIRPPTLSEMEGHLSHSGMSHVEALMHYGVKGMKWGQIRRSSDGGGYIKAKGRPTYTDDERRAAKTHVKAAKKAGRSKALDSEGFGQDRLAKLNTPVRRVVNYAFGTKYTNTLGPLFLASVVAASVAASGGAAVPAWAAASVGATSLGAAAAAAHANYKIFFQNMKNNPKIRAKIKLTPDEMAKYEVGRQFVKHIQTKRGSMKLSAMKGQQKLEIFDKEGRLVGTQMREANPTKKQVTKAEASPAKV